MMLDDASKMSQAAQLSVGTPLYISALIFRLLLASSLQSTSHCGTWGMGSRHLGDGTPGYEIDSRANVLWKPCTNLLFRGYAMYFDPVVQRSTAQNGALPKIRIT